MPDAIIAYTLIAITLLLMVIVVVTLIYARNTRAKLLQSVGLIENLFKISQTLKAAEQSQVEEIEKLGRRCENLIAQNSSLSSEIDSVKAQIEQLMDNDPEVKMYSKASKMVASGEQIDDVMEATGLPHAEVEVLYSLHNRK